MSYLREKLPEFSPAVVEMEPWRKALMDAAAIIRSRGWCQNDISTKDGRLCAVGAIKTASGTSPGERDWSAVGNQAYEAFGKFLKLDRPVAAWNDREERTAAEVIAALEAAARS